MSHFNTGVNVYVPVGGYNPDDIINRGRNYWSFVPTFSYTFLHPKRGHENFRDHRLHGEYREQRYAL